MCCFALGVLPSPFALRESTSRVRVRPREGSRTIIWPSTSGFKTIAAAVALILIWASRAAAAIWQLAVQRDEESRLPAPVLTVPSKQFCTSPTAIFAIGLIVFVAAFYVLYAREGTIADIPQRTFSAPNACEWPRAAESSRSAQRCGAPHRSSSSSRPCSISGQLD